MTPRVLNFNDKKDRQGLIAKAILEANVKTKICELSKFTSNLIIAINIVNAGDETAEINIWATENDTPELIDLIEYKISLEPNAVFLRNTIIIDGEEKIYIESTKNNVVVRIDGYDNRVI